MIATTVPATTVPTVYVRIVASAPLYGATCDRCPHWHGLITTDQEAHVLDVQDHARKHPDPMEGRPWTPGSVAPRRVTRGVEVGRVPVYGVHCDECHPGYHGRGSADRDQVARYVALHEAVHEASQRLRAGLSYEAIAAHRAAVQADPGRWGAYRSTPW
ncbi:hypothetical protein ACFQ7N_40395 [Streptomyces niveus]|uniref:hypothetical protein n=1 Tax=Streptomyces niveus TaxID=193462 RepID=UPI0036B9825D